MVLVGRLRRSLTVFPLVVALAVTISACGEDLGKSNFPRTTVPAAGAGTASDDGPITDAAVAADVLRLVKPCQFLTKDALSSFGTVPDDPSASSTEFDACGNSVQDPGGKTIRFSLKVGSGLIPGKDNAAGKVGGLPLRMRPTPDKTSCDLGAVTVQPGFGVQLSVDYNGGVACPPGQKLLDAVIAKLHNNPDKYQTGQGTLLTVDPCTVLDGAALDPVVPRAKPKADSLHSCQYTEKSDPTATAAFRPGLPPIEGDGYSKVDIGSGVTAYKKQQGSSSNCVVEWKHRAWEGENVEIASVQWQYVLGQAATDDPCGKAVTLAKAMVTKLPKA